MVDRGTVDGPRLKNPETNLPTSIECEFNPNKLNWSCIVEFFFWKIQDEGQICSAELQVMRECILLYCMSSWNYKHTSFLELPVISAELQIMNISKLLNNTYQLITVYVAVI